MLRAKAYPNGEITFSWERKKAIAKLAPEWEPNEEERLALHAKKWHGIEAAIAFFRSLREKTEQSPPLGLSDVPNLHIPARVGRRGGKGITRYSRRIIECGAGLLEDRFKRERCAFLTLTLPSSGCDWDTKKVNKAYNRFQQELLRELARHSLPQYIVGCIEAHPRRSEKEGRFVPHFHLVFVGRKRYAGWAINRDWFAQTWVRCLVNAGVVEKGTRWDAATRVERVEKSVSKYLGKYLSKAVKARKEHDKESLQEDFPGSWHKISRKLLTEIKKAIKLRTGAKAEALREILRADSRRLVLFNAVVYLENEGDRYWIGEYYRVPRSSLGFFLRACGDASLVE